MNTQTRRVNGNYSFRDENFSPAEGKSIWEDCPILAIMQAPEAGHIYTEDFYNYTAADWTVTIVSVAGTASASITDEIGGALLVTNSVEDNDESEFQKKGEAFILSKNKPIWFETRVKTSDATQTDIVIGLCKTDTSLIASASDGIYFRKSDGNTNILWGSSTSSSATNEGDTGKDLANSTYVKLGMKWDGVDSVGYYVNGDKVATNKTYLPETELCVSFAIMNGESAAKTLSVDYIKCVQAHTR